KCVLHEPRVLLPAPALPPPREPVKLELVLLVVPVEELACVPLPRPMLRLPLPAVPDGPVVEPVEFMPPPPNDALALPVFPPEPKLPETSAPRAVVWAIMLAKQNA